MKYSFCLLSLLAAGAQFGAAWPRLPEPIGVRRAVSNVVVTATDRDIYV